MISEKRRVSSKRSTFIILFGLFIFFSSCVLSGELKNLDEFYSSASNTLLIYPTVGPAAIQQKNVKKAIESYAQFLRQFGPVDVVKDTAFIPSESKVQLIFGTEQTNAFLRDHSDQLLAKIGSSVVSLAGKSWPNNDLGMIFLNPFKEGLMGVYYLPDLSFLERIRWVSHGSTEFLVFNSVSFYDSEKQYLAAGFFSKNNSPWTIEKSTFSEKVPIENMVVVNQVMEPGLFQPGDILQFCGKTPVKASNFLYLLDTLDPKGVFPFTILRSGKYMNIRIPMKAFSTIFFTYVPETIPSLSEEEWKTEARRIISMFTDSYIDPFDFMRSDEFKKACQNLAPPTASSSRNLLEFYLSLARFASAFNDGHVYINDELLKKFLISDLLRSNRFVFPFQPIIDGGKIFIPQNSLGLPIGGEIVQINDRKTEAILNNMALFTSGDTLAHKYSNFSRDSFPIFYYLSYGEESKFSLKILIDRKILEVELGAKSFYKGENMISSRDLPLIQEIASGVLLLRIDSFSFGNKMVKMINSAFENLGQKQIQNLVIDIRRNGGGNTNSLNILLAKLLDEPYRVYKMSRSKRSIYAEKDGVDFDLEHSYGQRYLHTVQKTFAGGKDVFDGRIFVLTSPTTFSTAFDCAAVLRERRQAILIGEAPGGKIIQSGSHFREQVLNGGMFISCPYQDFLPDMKCAKDYSSTPSDLVLEPDHKVTMTTETVKKNLDPCLEFIKDLLKNDMTFKHLYREK